MKTPSPLGVGMLREVDVLEQIGPPGHAPRRRQRIGRAGHRVEPVDDVLGAAVAVGAVACAQRRPGVREKKRPPEKRSTELLDAAQVTPRRGDHWFVASGILCRQVERPVGVAVGHVEDAEVGIVEVLPAQSEAGGQRAGDVPLVVDEEREFLLAERRGAGLVEVSPLRPPNWRYSYPLAGDQVGRSREDEDAAPACRGTSGRRRCRCTRSPALSTWSLSMNVRVSATDLRSSSTGSAGSTTSP